MVDQPTQPRRILEYWECMVLLEAETERQKLEAIANIDVKIAAERKLQIDSSEKKKGETKGTTPSIIETKGT